MNYPEFETAFEARFQTHTDTYPYAVEYHRARFEQTIQYLLSSILEQTDSLIQQPETNWTHTEEIVSDILCRKSATSARLDSYMSGHSVN